MTARAGRLALLLWISIFIGLFGTVLPHLLPEVRIAAQLLYGIPLVIWALMDRKPVDTIDFAVALALCIHTLIALTSRDVLGSVETVALAGLFALTFRFMRVLSARVDLREAAAFAAIIAIALWLLAFLVVWTWEKVRWVSLGGGLPDLVESRQTLFWLSGNMVPFLGLCGLGMLSWLGQPWRRLISPLMIGLAVITTVLSGGRAGAIGILVAGVVVALSSTAIRSRVGLRSAIVAGAVFVAAFAILAAISGGRLIEVSGFAARLPMWSQALEIFADNPLAGGGQSTYAWLRLEYADWPVRVNAPHAHSAILMGLAEGGIAMVAAWACIGTAVIVALARRRRRFEWRERVTIAVIVGFIVGAQLDEPARLPALTALAVTLAAWLIGPPLHGTKRWQAPAAILVARAIPLLVIVVGLVGAIPIDLARLEAATARRAALSGDLAGAAVHAEQAVVWYPDQSGYRLLLAQLELLSGSREAANAQYEAARTLNPFDARAWGGLAATSAGETRIEYLTRAVELADSPAYAWRLAEELELEGELAEAVDAYARAVALQSPLIGLIPLEGTGVVRSDVVDRLDAATESLRGLIPIGEDAVRADAAFSLGIRTGLPPEWEALSAAAASRWDVADRILASVQQQRPYDARTWRLAHAIAALRCDRVSAARAIALGQLTAEGFPAFPNTALYSTNDVPYDEFALDSYQAEAVPYPTTGHFWPGALVKDDCRG